MMTTEGITLAANACAKMIRDHAALMGDVLEGMKGRPIEAKRLDEKQMVAMVPPLAETLSHLLFMCDEIRRMAIEAHDYGASAAAESLKVDRSQLLTRWNRYASRREKAMRWLGFVQGTLWTLNVASIFQLKRMNESEADRLAVDHASKLLGLDRDPDGAA